MIDLAGDHPPVLALDGVGLDRSGRHLLHDVDWQVGPGQRWVVLGPNGSGKTSLLQIAALLLHPSRGTVTVLGEQLGRTDVRTLRRRIGLASQALADRLRPDLAVADVVMTARYAALEPWWHTYDDDDRRKARRMLDRIGIGHLAGRRFGTLSSGERQRAQLARTLMADPELLLLDEPTAGLDLGGREEFVASLAVLGRERSSPPVVLVTHHVEEVPPGWTHALLLRSGGVVASGPIGAVLTEEALSATFGLPLHLEHGGDRWRAWARG